MTVQALERELSQRLGRDHCIAVGRGAAAIWLALDVLAEARPDRTKVVLPASLCASPPAVARLAGLQPLFCDVETLSGNLDPAALAVLLRGEEGVLCVLAAHLYGQPAKIEAIEAICRTHEVPLIEDAAQAFGATIGARPAGAFGDLSILSFGHTKIIDAGGGGAILTDDPALARRLRTQAAELSPPQPTRLATWSQIYRTGYYDLIEKVKSGEEPAVSIGELSFVHSDAYRYALTDRTAFRILEQLGDLDANIARRRAMADLLEDRLAGLPVVFSPRAEGGVPWRFGLLVADGRRDETAAALREAGYDASAWYPAVARFFVEAPDWRERWPGAARIEDEILNLWVDQQVDEYRILGACAVIRATLGR